MEQNSNQGWQQIQANIESFFNQTLVNDVPRVEYKPRFIALLETTSESHQNEQETGM